MLRDPESSPDLTYYHQALTYTNEGNEVLFEKMTYLAFHVLCIILPVDVTSRGLALDCQCGVADLRWQSIFEIKKARLADVLYFGACLTDNGRFEAHANAGVPTKNGERSGTCAA